MAILGPESKAGLSVRVERDGEALVVGAIGELDLVNASTLEAALRRRLPATPPK
jgi:hypothetical protein